MMEQKTLIIPAKIDGQTFFRFALFDTFRRQGRWKAPALFAAIFAAAAAVCFALRQRRTGAALLGGVLLAVGLGLPAAYVLSFLLSVRRRGKALDGSKIAYTIHLKEEGVLALTGEQQAEYRWEEIHRAYRAQTCLYLYVSAQKAFLLPECPQSEAVWEILRRRLPAACVDLR